MAEPENPFVVVAEQKADDALWVDAETAAEAYLRRALRRLHAAIEWKPWPPEKH